MLLFSKMNSRQENHSKLSFTARIVTKYSLEHCLSICGEKMSKGFLTFCKLTSNLIPGQIIVSNLTNMHKLNSCINYAGLRWNIKCNNYSGLQFEMHLLKAIKLGANRFRLFNPLTHQARWKMKMMHLESDFRLKQATTKNPINKLAMNNRRLLMAAEFYFVHPVEKDS